VTFKSVILCLAVVASAPAHAQDKSINNEDPLITVLPARDVSYNSSFASRRNAIAMRDDPSMSKRELARAAVSDFAKCLYEDEPVGGRKILALGPGRVLTKQVRAYANGICLLRGYLNFHPSDFQLALFGVAYRAKNSRAAPASLAAPTDFLALSRSASEQTAKRFLALRRFGDCVVRTDPVAAHNVVVTDVATAREAEAFEALRPSLGACLEKDASVELSKELIKGLLADVLYRNASALADTPSGAR
jgi:hypothetical protein